MFKDRADAGKRLAEALRAYRGTEAIVYALPRGGVVLGRVVADELGLPLDLVIPRKIGHPHDPEYAVCAVTEDGALICNETERRTLDTAWLAGAVETERREAKRRQEVYLAGRPHRAPQGKIAIIVDDGIATGLTIRAALVSLRSSNPAKIVVAVPCSPPEVTRVLKKEADDVIVLTDEEPYLGAVGAYYGEFPQVTDEEVMTLLASSDKVQG